jgi:hypothetical protein
MEAAAGSGGHAKVVGDAEKQGRGCPTPTAIIIMSGAAYRGPTRNLHVVANELAEN